MVDSVHASHMILANAAANAITTDKAAMEAKKVLVDSLIATISNLEEWLDDHPKADKAIKADWKSRIAKLGQLLKSEKRALADLKKERLADFLALQMSQMS